MTRPPYSLLLVEGTLEATSPLHVGGAEDSVETDLPLARNGAGKYCVPGSSLAGAFRAWATDAFPGHPDVAKLFGSSEDVGSASRLLVEDAIVEGDATEVWDGVGIDREWGTAATQIKFDRAILPTGTKLGFEFEAELPIGKDGDTYRTIIGHLLDALEHGEVSLGAGQTRGLGTVKLVSSDNPREPRIRESSFADKRGAIDWLSNARGATVQRARLTTSAMVPTKSPSLTITIPFKPAGPLMVKANRDGLAVDMLPMVSANGAGKMALVIPGSSIKGALRSQAERIVRTLKTGDRFAAWNNVEGRERHRKQVDEPLVDILFGMPRPARLPPGSPRPVVRHGQGALSVATCFSTNLSFESDHWRRVETSTREKLDDSLVRAGMPLNGRGNNPSLNRASHVAIDRWTGGAADGALFAAFEPVNVIWSDITLSMNLSTDRIPAAERLRAIALIILVVRDLCTGWIPIGFGGNRGYGSIEPTDPIWTFDGTIPPEFSGASAGAQVDWAPHLPAIERAWREWVGEEVLHT